MISSAVSEPAQLESNVVRTIVSISWIVLLCDRNDEVEHLNLELDANTENMQETTHDALDPNSIEVYIKTVIHSTWNSTVDPCISITKLDVGVQSNKFTNVWFCGIHSVKQLFFLSLVIDNSLPMVRLDSAARKARAQVTKFNLTLHVCDTYVVVWWSAETIEKIWGSFWHRVRLYSRRYYGSFYWYFRRYFWPFYMV